MGWLAYRPGANVRPVESQQEARALARLGWRITDAPAQPAAGASLPTAPAQAEPETKARRARRKPKE